MDRRNLLLLLPFLPSCTPSLGLFDTLAPKDFGAERAATALHYGPAGRQTLDVYRPAGDHSANPVVIFFYGGSWRSGDRSDYNFMGAALAAQGFTTIVPNYRLVPEVRFPTFIEDCAQAVKWAQTNAAQFGGDTNRIVLMGHSAGAYNAIMIALDPTYITSAGGDMQSIRGAVGLAGPYDFYPFDVEATQNAFGEAHEPEATQPVNFARADAPPLLLLWGEQDTTVGPRNIQSLERAMSQAGGAVETKLYPGIDHIEIMLALSQPFRGLAPVLDDVSQFVRRVAAST